MVTRYGQADVPREVSGRGGPAVRPAAADFPRDVCLTVSRNHAVFLLYAPQKAKRHPLVIYIHYSDVIMSTMASQITGVSIVCSAVCSGAHQRKHQSSASLAFVRGIHR